MLLEKFTEVRKYLACVASSKILPGGKTVHKTCMPQAKLKGALKQAKVFQVFCCRVQRGKMNFSGLFMFQLLQASGAVPVPTEVSKTPGNFSGCWSSPRREPFQALTL